MRFLSAVRVAAASRASGLVAAAARRFLTH